MSTLQTGTVVDGRYHIVRLVAEGGMSEVYEVSDERLPGRFALKCMRDWIGDARIREEMGAQFEREASVLATLSHANLPRVTDHFVHDGRRCLVEELVDGDTLEKIEEARRGHLDENEVLRWALQICDALDYLHGKGIIYRDLKPSNCMITQDGVVKLIDFGIVRFFSTGKSRDTIIMGTPGFAAPEQYGRDQTDARADIFALGVLLHHLLTGYDPTGTPFVFPAPRGLNPAISERLERVVMKAVALDPAERFPTVDDMRQALKGEVVLLEDVERFHYAEEAPKPRDLHLASAGIVGAGAATAMLVWNSVTFTSFAILYTPFWLALLLIQFVGRRRRAATRIEVTQPGILFREGARQVSASWTQVQSVTFARDAFLKVRGARVHTDQGDFTFIVEGTRGTPGDAFDIPSLENSARLCELLLKKAKLAPARPGAEEFVRV